MDHQEQHHQRHEKEREHKKKEQKEYERAQDKKLLPVHPTWLLGIGIALVLLAMLVWTLFLH
jgi:hypothetical protein